MVFTGVEIFFIVVGVLVGIVLLAFALTVLQYM